MYTTRIYLYRVRYSDMSIATACGWTQSTSAFLKINTTA